MRYVEIGKFELYVKIEKGKKIFLNFKWKDEFWGNFFIESDL